MLHFQRREPLSERVIFKMTPDMKVRVYEKAARRGITVSDFTRQALAAAVGEAA